MTWALACTSLFALIGWGAFAVCRGLLAVNRRRVSRLKGDLACVRYDLAFATEKLAEFIDRTNIAEGKLRAREKHQERTAAYERKRRAN